MTQQTLEQKTERAWLVPYLLVGDRIFGVGRYNWWINGICSTAGIPTGDIPKIEFKSVGSSHVRAGLPTIDCEHLSPMGARKIALGGADVSRIGIRGKEGDE